MVQSGKTFHLGFGWKDTMNAIAALKAEKKIKFDPDDFPEKVKSS
jgi:hypothetical protein